MIRTMRLAGSPFVLAALLTTVPALAQSTAPAARAAAPRAAPAAAAPTTPAATTPVPA
ncbi:hypothetical protein H7F53_16710, partial [Novosphingobium piscinae]|nr:hypothetical protein [Novosphingobium piscinae]